MFVIGVLVVAPGVGIAGYAIGNHHASNDGGVSSQSASWEVGYQYALADLTNHVMVHPLQAGYATGGAIGKQLNVCQDLFFTVSNSVDVKYLHNMVHFEFLDGCTAAVDHWTASNPGAR